MTYGQGVAQARQDIAEHGLLYASQKADSLHKLEIWAAGYRVTVKLEFEKRLFEMDSTTK